MRDGVKVTRWAHNPETSNVSIGLSPITATKTYYYDNRQILNYSSNDSNCNCKHWNNYTFT